LRLDFPSGSWLGDVSRARPDATLRTTETVAAVEGDVTALTVTGTDRAETVEALRAHDRVDRIDIVDRTGPATRVRVVAPAPPPHVAAAREVGIPIEDPVAVTDGRATLDIVDDRSRLTAFGRRLTAEGVTVGIEASDADEEPILTDAQRDLVLAAVAAGYYDTPRECTLTDLAKARGLAKSTCSETLHRAEGRVLRRFVAGEFDDEDSETSVGKGIGDESEREPDRDGHHRTVTALGT
jgi:predicted DNA binding protein